MYEFSENPSADLLFEFSTTVGYNWQLAFSLRAGLSFKLGLNCGSF